MAPRWLLPATLVALSAPALAQSPADGTPLRVRGVIESHAGEAIVVKSRDGQELTIALAPNLTVSAVVARSLADVKQGDFVGVAATNGDDGKLHAQEVLILPEAARGSNEGHYAWDLMPESTMTNATVAERVSGVSGPILTLRYKDGEKKIVVPPEAPIVTFVPGGARPGQNPFLRRKASNAGFHAAGLRVKLPWPSSPCAGSCTNSPLPPASTKALNQVRG